jgi:hypothetical protein
VADGQRALKPLRALGKPIADVVGVQPYAAWQTAFDPLLTPGAHNYWKSHNFNAVTSDVGTTIQSQSSIHSRPAREPCRGRHRPALRETLYRGGFVMKIAVLGSGVIGVTTAYYLAKAAHEVTVLDRCNGPAPETSFANAGEISPGYASPWAAPGIPVKALRWLFMRHAPLILRPTVDLAMLSWVVRMLRNCTSARYALNKSRMVRLAEYSRDCLIALRAETRISYDERMRGTLQLFRSAKQVDGAAKDIEVLAKWRAFRGARSCRMHRGRASSSFSTRKDRRGPAPAK